MVYTVRRVRVRVRPRVGHVRRIVETSLTIFTALQYAAGLSDREGVRLSVRHSVNCDKTKAPSEKKFNYD